jgi:putative phage-type endonuclease
MHSVIEQGSAEWHQQRLGKVTASRIADVMAKTKTGYSASRANYMAELLVERLTGQPADRFTSAAMQWGTENEPAARAHYEMLTDSRVESVGFVPHPEIAQSGASPDGFAGDDGLVEIKCPNTATHIDTLLGAEIEGKYIKQMQWQMACTGRKWCDFVSYDPRLPMHLQMNIARVMRDNKAIAEMESEIIVFLLELERKDDELKNLTNQQKETTDEAH